MKRIAALLMAMLMLTGVCAAAEIEVAKGDLHRNEELDSNVTNILVLMQDADVTDTMMIASINDRTGRAVMTRLSCDIEAEVDGEGTVPLGAVYALGAQGSKGPLAVRTVNELLELNIDTYVALDLSMLPRLVEAVGALNMELDALEAEAMHKWEGINELTGEEALAYVRLALEDDNAARSRGYDALMQLLYQGLHSGDVMRMLSLGSTLLESMDTNLNPFSALTLVTAVRGGDDRRELALPGELEGVEAMREAIHREVYE